MGTTAGSWALVGAKATANSVIAQKFVDAGLIILGKTNMTEFAGMKMTMISPGWSALGGQTLSPYAKSIAQDETLLGHSVREQPLISLLEEISNSSPPLSHQEGHLPAPPSQSLQALAL